MLGEVGQTYQPRGATALVMDPRNGEILALANWPRVDANDSGDAPAYARQNRAVAAQLRARLDLQGVHRRRRARGGADRAGHRRSTCRPTIQVADRDDRGGARARRRHADRRRDPGPVLERRLGDDRPASSAPTRFDRWVRRFGFGAPHRRRPARRGSAASCPSRDDYSGSSIGNLPIGQGLAVTPIQMAAGLHGDRQRRRRCARRTWWPATASPAGACSPRRTARRGLAHARGRARAGRHRARRPRSPGYTLAGKTGTAEKPDDTAATRRPTSWPRSSATRRRATRACSWR